MDLQTGKGHAVDPVRVRLVGGAWVLGEDAQKGSPLFIGHLLQEGGGAVHGQHDALHPVGKAPRSLGQGIGVRNIGFDIVDGGAVQEVGSGDMEDGAKDGVLFHGFEAHGGEALTII